jgi:hypothetical protein
MRATKIILIGAAIAIGACFGACKSDDDGGGAGTNAGGGAGGTAGGGTGGTAGGGAGGIGGGGTGGSGGAAGTMGGAGGMGGAAGTMGGAGGTGGGGTGGTGGSAGGGSGGTGGMAGGGMGGMAGGGMGGGEPDAGPAAATFTDVYAIIEMRCGGGMFGCHVMGSSGMLNMQSKMNAFDNLVGVDSEECDGETRVVAGDADGSLLIKALEGTACIDQMPDGRDPLPEDEIQTIRDWIEAGAMND